MRKLLAILLLAFFGAPMVTPLFALNVVEDARLPACCRRNGQHHCQMLLGENAFATRIAAPCPRYPRPQSTAPGLHTPGLSAVLFRSDVPAGPMLRIAEAEGNRRLARERSRHKRGPPTISL